MIPDIVAVEDLTPVQAEMELKRLATEIARHDRAYHSLAAPLVSDAIYDQLAQRNRAIEQCLNRIAKLSHLMEDMLQRSK